MSGEVLLEQAFYGSRTGESDFHILAASPGLSREERDSFLHAANLGGSAQTADDPTPLYAFFPLDRQGRRWGFCRTVFLGFGGRGNDYLAHLLALDAETLAELRGDLFLLEDFGLFGDSKPNAEEPLAAVALDRQRAEEASRRRLMLPAGRPEQLERLLRALAEGPVSCEVASGREGASLCRAVLASLPPDDRVRLSFCSRFSLPRGMSFRLAAYRSADRRLAERHLADFADRPLPAAPPGGDAFTRWTSGLRIWLEPLCGLSLLARPEEASARMSAFQAALGTVGETPADDGDPTLLPLLIEPRNRPLGAARLLAPALFTELRTRVEAALEGKATMAAIFAACGEVRESDGGGQLAEELAAIAERRWRRGGAISDLTTGVLATLLVASPARLARAYGSRASLLTGVGPVSEWIASLEESNPTMALELLTCWFTHWRLAAGSRCLSGVVQFLSALPGPGAVRAVLSSLEAAAPPAGDPERQPWFLALLRDVRPRSGALFPPLHAARLAAQEGLLDALGSRERAELVPALAAELPEMASELIEHGPCEYPLLLDLAEACQQGLLGRELEGAGWDMAVRPALWDLAARVAQAAVPEAARRQDANALAEMAWLLWAASRLLAGRRQVSWEASPQSDRRFGEALSGLLAACPTGAADIALRALYRFVRSGPGLASPLGFQEFRRLRRQAWRDAHRHSPQPGFLLGTLTRMAWLDDRPAGEVFSTS